MNAAKRIRARSVSYTHLKKPEQEEHYQKVIEEMEEILHLEKGGEITFTKEKDGYKVMIK